jgi:hypothetical protein
MEAQSASCCDTLALSSTIEGQGQDQAQDSLCFQELGDVSNRTGRCGNPVSLISSKWEVERCESMCSPDRSGQARLCIVPDKREQLVRILIKQTEDSKPRVVLFQGSTTSIYSALTISPYVFRMQILDFPYHLYRWWTLLISYTLNLSLAMALLNMLPLPSLDGDVYFQFILKAIVSRSRSEHHLTRNTDEDSIDGDRDEEEEIEGMMELGARVTSRPDSPTQLRRPSSSRFVGNGHAPLEDADQQRRSSRISRGEHGVLHDRIAAKIHQRFQWFTIILAVFVFGGSILLHAMKEAD